MAGEIYKKPILFAIVSAVVILIGTIVTMFIPMLTPQMHPKLENLKPYTPLQLVGRDVYMSEGCHYCHTQTVRPLKTEVMRYGEYSKAGEFAYDHPFLWGSKRTGPDLARIGGKYPDAWHYGHFEDPQKFFADSNMPKYGWLKDYPIDPAEAEASVKALGFPYTKADIEALKGKNKLDALVAYMQVLGTAVAKKPAAAMPVSMGDKKNPLAGNATAIATGKKLYDANCASCHGADGKGGIGPSVVDNVWLYKEGDVSDGFIYIIIAEGTSPAREIEGRTAKGGMPPYSAMFDQDKIWSMTAYIRSIQNK
jgi:cytochrome c oxidase cbb3-type subunit 2